MTKSKIYDCITYNGEQELFDIRYNVLKNYVDRFIIVEFDKTFSGKSKQRLFTEELLNYYNDKRIQVYYIQEKDWQKYWQMAGQSPNTQGAEHWKREFAQKESIKDCLKDCKDDDIIFIGDCDEIWNPEAGKEAYSANLTYKLEQLVYVYYLNQRSSENWKGTLVTIYGIIRDNCLNHLRTNIKNFIESGGWHFTSMAKSLKQKLQDSYSADDYATEEILDNIDENIKNDKDFLGRNFTYKVDESQWPDYLKKNREKYKHLLKP